jgi:UDP-glucose 4-epimerase
VEDVVDAVLLAHRASKPFDVYNVATDYITVTEIAHLAMEVVGLDPSQVHLEYTGGDRGWKGDVPVVRLNTDRIQSLGWHCHRTSRQALCISMRRMLDDMRAGKM